MGHKTINQTKKTPKLTKKDKYMIIYNHISTFKFANTYLPQIHQNIIIYNKDMLIAPHIILIPGPYKPICKFHKYSSIDIRNKMNSQNLGDFNTFKNLYIESSSIK